MVQENMGNKVKYSFQMESLLLISGDNDKYNINFDEPFLYIKHSK